MLKENTFYDLSLLSYFDARGLNMKVSELIKQTLADEKLLEDYKDTLDFPLNYEALSRIHTEDYEDMIVKDYFNDNKRSGIVYYVFETKESLIITFRGSESLDGIRHRTGWQDWIDNFQMFLKDPSFQQIYALKLMQNLEITKPFYMCGHSKGGNLALYIALTMKKELEENLLGVYSFNAPGITKPILSMYEDRANDENFKNKLTIFENENDTVSSFFENLTEPKYIRSCVPCTNFIELYHNHNLYGMDFDDNLFVYADKKTGITKFVYHFVNDLFLNQKEEKIENVVHFMDDYFGSGLVKEELYKVLIYHISKYTSLFEDISYEELKTITFQDLIERRKTKNLVAKMKELQPKDAIVKIVDNLAINNPMTKLNEVDIKEITQSFIDNYELLVKEKTKEIQQVFAENNEKITNAMKAILNRENEE